MKLFYLQELFLRFCFDFRRMLVGVTHFLLPCAWRSWQHLLDRRNMCSVYYVVEAESLRSCFPEMRSLLVCFIFLNVNIMFHLSLFSLTQ